MTLSDISFASVQNALASSYSNRSVPATDTPFRAPSRLAPAPRPELVVNEPASPSAAQTEPDYFPSHKGTLFSVRAY